jgi:hypothetical protein
MSLSLIVEVDDNRATLLQYCTDRFSFHIIHNRAHATFTAPSRLLVTANRQRGVKH